MPIIKERIKFENQDVNLKIDLGVDNKFSGYQQEINDLTEKTKTEKTNPIVDNEVKKFRYGLSNYTNLIFYFCADGAIYVNKFTAVGARFSDSEIDNNSMNIRNSFFIMDFYDSFDDYTQTRIFTIHQTQILDGKERDGIPIPKYRIHSDTISQFYNWYVPNTFIDQNLKNGITTVTGYVKFSFFNAKYGDITLFYNNDNKNLSTPEKMYFKVELDLINMIWNFDYAGNSYPPNAKAYQVQYSNMYSEKINNSIESFDNKQQDYPDNNVFDVEEGSYVTE